MKITEITPELEENARKLIEVGMKEIGLIPTKDNDPDLKNLCGFFKPPSILLVALKNSQVIGTCGIKLREHRAELRRFYVQKSHRGRGVGKKLMEAVTKKAMESPAKIIYGRTPKTNKGQLKMYKRLGYQLREVKDFREREGTIEASKEIRKK